VRKSVKAVIYKHPLLLTSVSETLNVSKLMQTFRKAEYKAASAGKEC